MSDEQVGAPSVRGEDILERLVNMPVASWRYKWEPEGVLHIGPMAQDFYDAFGLGSDNRRIVTVDGLGVLIISMQALLRRVQKLEATVASYRAAGADEVPPSAPELDDSNAR